jgi:hypothetical protein
VGALWASPLGLRLAGRDPATGIELALSIPAEEISTIRVSSSWSERVAGEECVILELADTIPILVRELGLGPLDPRELSARIQEGVTAAAPPLVA